MAVYCDVIELLMELCDLLHMANCTERSVAIIQSMIEFNVNRPAELSSHELAIESFQQFYDSGTTSPPPPSYLFH